MAVRHTISRRRDHGAARAGGDGEVPARLRPPRERTEGEELRRLNRTLRALSNSSHAMLRADDEAEFLEEVCRIVVEDCGHAMVWIGFAEDDAERSIRPVAHAGFERGYLESLRLSWADTERGRGPTGTAIRTGRPCACTSMLTDPRFAPWRQEAVRRGYASSLALPLQVDGRAFGALCIYSRDPGPLPDEEVELLLELASDLAYGITTLRLRAAHARAEEALRRSEERYRAIAEALAESDRHKDEFLAVLSHELRNPLAAVRNALLVLDEAPAASPQAAHARQVQRRQIAHLTRLVDDLLDVTRISQGKIALDRSTVELRELVARAADDQRAAFEKRRVRLTLALPPEPIWLDADPVRISQVLGNLLHNASKFAAEGGTAALSVTAAGGRAELRVRDDGVGMEPELLSRLFTPFVQADADPARAHGGLGLGLALTKGLVELHGGSVRASSPGPGRGCELLVTLPTVEPPAAPAQEPPGPGAAPSRSILVVDDYPDSAQVLADVLALRGHRVRVAASGTEGIAAARELVPDFVLCDIGLPDMEGYEVARALRAEPRLRSTRLVALSGFAQSEDRDRAARAGFDAHLPKPAPLELLDELLAHEE